MRTILGDPDQATFRAGYSEAYERQGMGIFTDLYGGNPGQHHQPDPQRVHRPGAGRRIVAGAPAARRTVSTTRLPGVADLSDRRPRQPRRWPQRLRVGHQDRPRANLDGQLPALDHQGHGGRRSLRRHARLEPVVDAELQRPPDRTERLLRRVPPRRGEPAGEQRLGRHEPHGIDRLLRSRAPARPAADLSRLPERQNQRRRPSAYTGTSTWSISAITQDLVHAGPIRPLPPPTSMAT